MLLPQDDQTVHCRLHGVDDRLARVVPCRVDRFEKGGLARSPKTVVRKEGRSLAGRPAGNDAFSLPSQSSPPLDPPWKILPFLARSVDLLCFGASVSFVPRRRATKKGREVRLWFGPQWEELVCKKRGIPT